MPAVASVAGLPSRLGKYELLMPLAAGGMARIYIGRSTGIGSFERHVVLKLITPERANDHTAVQMFLDEARLAASLNHQNVAQVFEVGEDSNIHYLAMEYVHGQDLRALLAKAGSQGTRIPLELALTVVAGAAAGLNHAHERRAADGSPMGIVHRDVSPSNIMIGYDGAVKLLDFGIAKAAARSVETQSGIIKGKFAYMAPEQCRGREVDRRSDVFSLGIILYEISTQHRCFRADSDFDTMHRIVTGDVVRPTRLVQGYPQALEAIVMKALAVDPAQRYQSAGLLLEALESFAVSSRMSLSTMGLGRFMRDMFGEVQEPWLSGPVKAPIAAKESTISSTNGHGDVEPNLRAATERSEDVDALDASTGVPPVPPPEGQDDGRFPDSGAVHAAKTVLDLPGASALLSDEPAQPDWNAKSYPSTPPNMASSQTLPPDNIVMRPTPQPQPAQRVTPARGVSANVIAQPQPLPKGSQPIPAQQPQATPPRGQFQPATPGSGTGPALPEPKPIVSTRHGYSSGAMTGNGLPQGMPVVAHFPATDPDDDLDVQLRPSKRALFVGIAILGVGVIAVVALMLRGGDKDDVVTPMTTGSGSAEQAPPAHGSAEALPQPVLEDLVTVHLVSEPAGADVLLAGTKIGVTPFDGKLKKGTKIVPLVVRKAGYVEFTAKIDLASAYSNDKITLAKLEDMKPDTKPTDTKPTDTKPSDTTPSETKRTDTNPTETKPSETNDPKTDGKPHLAPPSDGKSNDATLKHTTPPHANTTTHPTATKPPPPPPKPPAPPPAPKCQPASSVNPFDTSCDGKPCPVCK